MNINRETNSLSVPVYVTGSGSLVVSAWDVTTQSTVGSVLTANMDYKAQSPGNAYAGSAGVYVLFAR